MKRFFLTSALAIVASASSAGAASISLKLVDSFQRSGPFGLAFDGTYIYWSQNNAQVHQMTTSGVDTGLAPFSGQVWSELAWDGSQLMSTRSGNLYKFDVGGGNLTTSSIRYDGLIDGLDYDQGDLWYSPDVDVVYRLSGDGTTTVGPNPFLGGAGGYSGVERIQATDKDYVVVVNDASNPRNLCVHNLDASLVGCQQFANARYEGLAFDGRYVWAADYYGDKIDKYDILGDDGGSIINPGEPSTVPLPASLPLLGAAFGLFGVFSRRRKT